MSRGRKKTVVEESPVEEITDVPVVEEMVDVPVVEEPFVEEITEVPVVEEPIVAEEAITEPVETEVPAADDDDERRRTIEYVRMNLTEHSRRRPGAVSNMLPPVYSLVLPNGRVGFFTLPINIEEGAVEDGWKKCKAFMTAEEYVAFIVAVTGIPRPPFYSVFRVIALN